jgi:hypothetical protein
MDILNHIIQSLNKEEVRFFKLYSKRLSTSEERKDLSLFDHIRKNGFAYNEDKITQKLYPKGTKNAYYRLKNRVTEEINKSLTVQHYNEGEEVQIHNLITCVKLYIKKRSFELAIHYLKKAEKIGAAIEAYDLLDIIYSEYIKLSQEYVKLNPEIYILKRKENLKLLNSLREMDDVLAMIIYKTKTTQNFNSSENPIVPLLQKTVNEVLGNKNLKKGAKLRIKIFRAVSQILLQRHEYQALEDYLSQTYAEFMQEALFTKSNHESKLQMLTYMVNCLHINNKPQASLKYAALLKDAMEEFNGFKKDKYSFFYYNALVNNYGNIDKQKAIKILIDLKSSDWLKKMQYYEVFVFANLAILNFEIGEFKKSIKLLNQLYLLDSYKNTDESYKFKTEIAELIVRYELKDFDLLEYRMKQVQKDFKGKLNLPEYEREYHLIEIISELIYTNSIRSNATLKSKIEAFLASKDVSKFYSEMINYNEWIKSKLV